MKKKKINTKFYLAHPLNLRAEVREWELDFEKRTGIQLLNPFYDIPERDDINRIDSGLISGRSLTIKKEGMKIVERDLRQIEYADGLVGFIEKRQESFGTPMELFYNSRILQKPSYIITKSQRGHPWVIGLSTKIFKTKEGFTKYFENAIHKKPQTKRYCPVT